LDKAKKYLSIVGMRTVQELNEIPAIDMAVRDTRQQIMCSRSFSNAVFYIEEIITALSEYTQEAVKRLREDHLSCKYVTVYLMTNPFSEGAQYSNQASAALPNPTSFLPDILGTAIELLQQIYRRGYKYRKVMVCLMGLEADEDRQPDLFEDQRETQRKENLMRCFDTINGKYGRGTIRMGASDMAKKIAAMDDQMPWVMKRDYLSPQYTTRLADVPKVY
jgi:DNA polymerase V